MTSLAPNIEATHSESSVSTFELLDKPQDDKTTVGTDFDLISVPASETQENEPEYFTISECDALASALESLTSINATSKDSLQLICERIRRLIGQKDSRQEVVEAGLLQTTLALLSHSSQKVQIAATEIVSFIFLETDSRDALIEAGGLNSLIDLIEEPFEYPEKMTLEATRCGKALVTNEQMRAVWAEAGLAMAFYSCTCQWLNRGKPRRHSDTVTEALNGLALFATAGPEIRNLLLEIGVADMTYECRKNMGKLPFEAQKPAIVLSRSFLDEALIVALSDEH